MNLTTRQVKYWGIIPPQPIGVYFEFVPTPKRQRFHKGQVRIWVGLDCEIFGPFPSQITTSQFTWGIRFDLNNVKGADLRNTLALVHKKLVKAWTELLAQQPEKRGLVTGAMVMQQAGLQRVEEGTANGHA